MAFIPKIQLNFNVAATELNILDITGAYDGTTNLTGWGTPDACSPGDAGVDTSNIIYFYVEVYDQANTLLETITLDTALPLTYAGNFSYTTPTPISWSHGVGSFEYSLHFRIDTGCEFNLDKLPFTIGDIYNTTEGKLNICLNNNCSTLEIAEETTVLNSSKFFLSTGWEHNPTVVSDKVYIKIYDVADNLLDVIYLLDKTASPVVNVFPSSFIEGFKLDNYAWSNPDGYYKFKYIVETLAVNAEDPSTIYELGTFEKFYTCNAQACVDSLWLDAFNSCDNKDYADKVETAQDAQILLQGVMSKAACIDLTKAADIQATLFSICEINKCGQPDCGCN